MKTHVKAKNAAFVCLTALMIPISGVCGEEIDRTLEMPADGLVQIENLAGTIDVSTWDRSEVQIRGEAGDDVEEVEISSSSKGVQIQIHNVKNKRRLDDTNLYLRVPVGASIEAESVSADIAVSGIQGESITLNTVAGDLEVEASPQRVELASVSGDVELEGKVTRASVESVSGDITVDGPSGEISFSTVSGDVSLEAGTVSRGRFESVSGEMTLALSLEDGGRLNCDSMSGDINLRLPASQQADFGAQSFSGDINSEFGKALSVSKGPGTMLEHREGNNGAQIRLETFSGDISIRSE